MVQTENRWSLSYIGTFYLYYKYISIKIEDKIFIARGIFFILRWKNDTFWYRI